MRYRDYSKKGYVYYCICECGKRITADSTYCKSCAHKGERNARYKGGFITKAGYKVIVVEGKKYLEHRYVWEQHNGKIPKDYQIHHINKNKSDNRITNLELLKSTEHRALKHITNKKGLLRVCTCCNKKLELTQNFPPRRNKLGLIAGYRGRCKDCWRKHQTEHMRKWRDK